MFLTVFSTENQEYPEEISIDEYVYNGKSLVHAYNKRFMPHVKAVI
jgi:hypothetical protein